MPIIRVRELVKEFHSPKRQPGRFGWLRTLLSREDVVKRAVDGVSFTVDAGDLVGYIGPNGAGKSTTIKLLTGILAPTSGEIEVAGLVPWRERERNALNIGVVFGQRSQLWWDLPLIESFDLIARMYGLTPQAYRSNLDQFSSMLGLDEFLYTPVRQLSLGQRMRGDLTAAMLYEPRLLYLDEPTVGLDVVARARIRAFIEEINRRGQTTIILTTHDLADIERLCRRIILIDHGQVLYDGSVEALIARYAPYRIVVAQLADGTGAAVQPAGAELIRREANKVWLRVDREPGTVPQLIGALTSHYPVTDISITEPDLEQVIRDMYATEGSADGVVG